MARRADTRDVTRTEAMNHLRSAEAYLKQAQETRALADSGFDRAAAGNSAVLAATAAADAVCGLRLGSRWQGDHGQAHVHLRKVAGAASAASALQRVVRNKTDIQYLAASLTEVKLVEVIRQATVVVEFARATAAEV